MLVTARAALAAFAGVIESVHDLATGVATDAQHEFVRLSEPDPVGRFREGLDYCFWVIGDDVGTTVICVSQGPIGPERMVEPTIFYGSREKVCRGQRS